MNMLLAALLLLSMPLIAVSAPTTPAQKVEAQRNLVWHWFGQQEWGGRIYPAGFYAYHEGRYMLQGFGVLIHELLPKPKGAK